MFQRRLWAATHPIKPSRSSPSGPSKETTRPSAQCLGPDRDACHTLCLSNPTLYSQTAVVHDLHMHRCRTQGTHTTDWVTGRLGEVCDVSFVSPKFRCRPELPVKRRAGARCCMTTPKTRGMRPRGAHICSTLLNWRCRLDLRACAAGWIRTGLDWPCRWMRLFAPVSWLPSLTSALSRHWPAPGLAWHSSTGLRTRYVLVEGESFLASGLSVLDPFIRGFPFDPADQPDQMVSGDNMIQSRSRRLKADDPR